MLKCRYTQARLAALLNHELPVHTRRYVMHHIETCPHCRAEYATHKTVQERLQRELPRIGQPTPAALQRVWRGIERDVAPRARFQPRWTWLYSGAAFLFVLLILPLAVVSGYQAAPMPSYAVNPHEQTVTQTPTQGNLLTPVPTLIAQTVSTQPKGTDVAEILHNTPATPEPDS